MRYLNEDSIRAIGIEWKKLFSVIQDASYLLKVSDYSQPIKPYLRYLNPTNRIIAMPAYVGGKFDTAGIKWIASFPENIKISLPRAHAVTILNEGGTGRPKAIINTSLISSIRTVAVSGAVLNSYIDCLDKVKSKVNIGIIGLGPIGQLHCEMLFSEFSEVIDSLFVYDINVEQVEQMELRLGTKIVICHSWQEVFQNSSVLFTCTVSNDRYINGIPTRPSLYMNISLRDYEVSFFDHVDIVAVDNWEEVCRENTDLELGFKAGKVNEINTLTIDSILCDQGLVNAFDKVVMFNPMGMAIYDIAVAEYYYKCSMESNQGIDI